jgi:trans-aconitate 2-methyltransferase
MNRPAKNFAPIQEDYAFFLDHSTEPASDLRGYRALLGEPARLAGSLHFLDFGCGPGTFTARFLDELACPPDQLRITLVDPVADYRQQACERLHGRSAAPIRAWAELPAAIGPEFHLVLANHVLYYVADLDGVLSRILGSLAPGGRFVTAVAGRHNALVDFWFRSFPWIGLDVPYHTAEDVEAALTRRGQPFRRHEVSYELAFPDTEANRLKILRFLLADYFDRMPRRKLLDLFEPYAKDGRVEIRTEDVQFAVGG